MSREKLTGSASFGFAFCGMVNPTVTTLALPSSKNKLVAPRFSFMILELLGGDRYRQYNLKRAHHLLFGSC
jgi:hypothetical protein